MDHDQVKKPRIFLEKPGRWPDLGFGHLTACRLVRQTQFVTRHSSFGQAFAAG
jgi:hypothetical protein